MSSTAAVSGVHRAAFVKNDGVGIRQTVLGTGFAGRPAAQKCDGSGERGGERQVRDGQGLREIANLFPNRHPIARVRTQPSGDHLRTLSTILAMCKHILNAQVAIRAPCCKQWFDCAECHAESQDHRLRKTTEMAFMCKKCKKAFRKDMASYEDSDEYCPHCDNHYVVEAKTPQAALGVEGDDPRINARMLKDERVNEDPTRSIFAQDFADRLG